MEKHKNIIIITILVVVLIFSLLIFQPWSYFNKTANIVFTTDSNYQKYLKVALVSLIRNKKPDSIYNVFILTVDLPKEKSFELEKMSKDNVNIKVLPVSLEDIKEIGKFRVLNYVSRADLFKFLMPEILKDLNKALYLDCDILVLKDLIPLYNTNISHTYLAAVRRYTKENDWVDLFWRFRLQYPRYNYNCGIMLFNLKKMRKDNISQKLIEAKNKDTRRTLMTQNAFNEVIPDYTIKKLSPIYNVYSRWEEKEFEEEDFTRTYFPYLIGAKSLKEIYSKAAIIHYAGYGKPWHYPEVNYGLTWWEYASLIDKNWKPEEENRAKFFD